MNKALNNEAVKDGIVPSVMARNEADVDVSLESILLVSERYANSAYGFFLGKRVAYPFVANYVRNTWGKYRLVRSILNSSTGLFFFQIILMDGLDSMLENEDVGNVPVSVKLHGVSVTAFIEDDLSVIATKLGTPLMFDSYTSDMCIQSWGRSSYARALIEIQADVELKDTIVVVMPKFVGDGFYTCTIRVEYEWKPPRYSCCKIFGHVQDECPKNVDSGVMKNLKNPSQAPNGVPVDLKVGFKPAKQVYRPVSKKTNNNTSGNKKKDVEPIKENVESSRKPLDKVDSSGDHDSEDEVESVDNEMASFLASKKVGYGTNSMLEQWKKTYENVDYDYDPYDDDIQVKDNKIDLFVQQYEKFTIIEEEYIDSGFARFNNIITSLKAPDEGFSSKNYVIKFLRALHPKWRAKVTAIKESKDLSSLALDELIGNLKVHEVIMEKDSEIYKGKKERVKSIALKVEKESTDDETSTSGSDDEEYVMAVRNFKKFFRRKSRFVRQPREEKKSFCQMDDKKTRVIENSLDAVIQIISLANIQSLHGIRNKKHLLGALRVIAKMKPRTKQTKKLVSWINHQMRQILTLLILVIMLLL
ncbi:hypothetical protein Tco_1049012 [Tanacetum coccineum]